MRPNSGGGILMYNGGTMEQQNRRTVELIEWLIAGPSDQPLTLHGLLYLLHDTQSHDQLKALAEISAVKPFALSGHHITDDSHGGTGG